MADRVVEEGRILKYRTKEPAIRLKCILADRATIETDLSTVPIIKPKEELSNCRFTAPSMPHDRNVRSFFEVKADFLEDIFFGIGRIGKAHSIKLYTGSYRSQRALAAVLLGLDLKDFDCLLKVCRELVEHPELVTDHHHWREDLISKRDKEKEDTKINQSFFEEDHRSHQGDRTDDKSEKLAK